MPTAPALEGTIVGAADMHLHDPNHPNHFESLARLSDLVDLSNDIKADVVVVAGDLFHTGRPHPETVARAKDQFNRMETAKAIITGGNHDHTNIAATYRNPIDAYLADQPWCHATVDAKAEVVDFNGMKFGLVPWLRVAGSSMLNSAEEELRRMIGDLGDELSGYPSLLFGHIALEEASFSSGRRGSELQVMTTALEPHVSTAFLDELPVAVWRLGHIHKRQSMGSGLGGYIGSSYKTSFGERKEDKGFDIIKLYSDNTATVEFHKLVVRELVQVNLFDDPRGLRDLDDLLKQGDRLRIQLPHDTDYTAAQSRVINLLTKKGIEIDIRRLPREIKVARQMRQVTSETTPLEAMTAYLDAEEMLPERANALIDLFKDVYEEIDTVG